MSVMGLQSGGEKPRQAATDLLHGAILIYTTEGLAGDFGAMELTGETRPQMGQPRRSPRAAQMQIRPASRKTVARRVAGRAEV